MLAINMKRIIFLILGFIAFPVFSDTTFDNKPILYCPHHVTCTTDGKLDSCKISDNQYGVWSDPYNAGRVSKGTYVLKNVSASYQSPDNGFVTRFSELTRCNYSLIDNQKIEKQMIVGINLIRNEEEYSEISFEAFLTNNSQWSVQGWIAECLSEDPLLCPLSEIPEISLIALRAMNVRTFYWNDREINTYPRLTYNGLLNICGATSECKINVGEKSRDQYKLNGVITVNITQPDNVQIVSIETAPSSSCLLKKIEPFNTIYCDSGT